MFYNDLDTGDCCNFIPFSVPISYRLTVQIRNETVAEKVALKFDSAMTPAYGAPSVIFAVALQGFDGNPV